MAVSLRPTRLAIDPTAFVARSAVLVGEVSLGPGSSVWYNAVLRGDLAPVVVGAESNIQDGVTLHVEVDQPARVGRRVTVGHNAVVHAAEVEDECLIGIGALVLSGARVGRGSIVGAGAVVREGFAIPPGSLVLGVPARVVRPLTDAETGRLQENWRVYVAYARAYRDGEVDGRGGASP